MMAGASQDHHVLALCRSAFEAEHQSRWQDAYGLHIAVRNGLLQLADDAAFMDRERKRIARKQAKFYGTRLEVLQPILNDQQPGLQVRLPSEWTAGESIRTVNNGWPAISMVMTPVLISCFL